MITFRILMIIICPLFGIVSAIHFLKLKRQILKTSQDKYRAKELFKKMYFPFSAKKLQKELSMVADEIPVSLFFKWLFFLPMYRSYFDDDDIVYLTR